MNWSGGSATLTTIRQTTQMKFNNIAPRPYDPHKGIQSYIYPSEEDEGDSLFFARRSDLLICWGTFRVILDFNGIISDFTRVIL